MTSSQVMLFTSDARCCAECENFAFGAIIEGHEFKDGWHCLVNDVAGTHVTSDESEHAYCKMPELWEEKQ